MGEQSFCKDKNEHKRSWLGTTRSNSKLLNKEFTFNCFWNSTFKLAYLGKVVESKLQKFF